MNTPDFAWSPLTSYLVAGALFSVVTIAAPLARAAEFTPNESLVSEQGDLRDPEFSQSRAQFTWVDITGHLWVGNVDRTTGLFDPPDGKGQLIDPDSMTSDDIELLTNGPEWVTAAKTDHIVYTKFLPGKPHELQHARLAFAHQAEDGTWSHRFISPRRHYIVPYASSDRGDTAPRINYFDLHGNHYWRDLFDWTSETIVPQCPPSFFPMRFVQGARAVVFVAPVDGVSQVFRYWLDHQALEQLTFDDGDKGLHNAPWMLQSPEFGNEFVFFTIVDDRELRIYRQSASTKDWMIIRRVTAPQGGELSSAEPFTHNGRTYVFVQSSVLPSKFPSAIFLSNINAQRPLFRQLTPDTPLLIRHDPEVFITDHGPYIYFKRHFRAAGPNTGGIYRAHTGLLPPFLVVPDDRNPRDIANLWRKATVRALTNYARRFGIEWQQINSVIASHYFQGGIVLRLLQSFFPTELQQLKSQTTAVYENLFQK